jgi:DNA-binding transcriptional LysR family regulator
VTGRSGSAAANKLSETNGRTAASVNGLVKGGDETVIRRLRVFLAVVDGKSFSGAARRLGVSQPAVTQQVRGLEDALQTRLFSRLGRTVMLTDAGRRAATVAREMLMQIDAAFTALRGVSAQPLVLRIGFSAPQIAMPVASRFKASYPTIGLQFVAANTSELIELLRASELDVIFVGLQAPLSRFHCRLIFNQPLVAIVPLDDPWAGRSSITLDELCLRPSIIREAGSFTRQVFFEAAAKAGHVPEISYDVASREAACEAVAQGLGISTVLKRECPHDNRIAQVPIEDDTVAGGEFVVTYKSAARLPPVANLLYMLDGMDF